MNKIAFLFLTILSLSAFTIENSYETARQKAVRNGKVLMVLLIRKKGKDLHLLRTLLGNNKLRTLINEKAVFVVVVKETKQSYPIEMLYIPIVPALFFLDENELFLHDPLTGVITADEIEKILHQIQ